MSVLKQYEKHFPAVSDETFESRINLIKRTLNEHGYEFDSVKSDNERIYFKKENENCHGECSFGLWQIRHETDEDFEYGFHRFKNRLIHK